MSPLSLSFSLFPSIKPNGFRGSVCHSHHNLSIPILHYPTFYLFLLPSSTNARALKCFSLRKCQQGPFHGSNALHSFGCRGHSSPAWRAINQQMSRCVRLRPVSSKLCLGAPLGEVKKLQRSHGDKIRCKSGSRKGRAIAISEAHFVARLHLNLDTSLQLCQFVSLVHIWVGI